MALQTTILEGNRGYALNESGASPVVNTTAETSLFSSLIPGGKMGTNKILKSEMTFHITTPALSIPVISLTLKFGIASMVLFTNATLAANITDKPIILQITIANLNTTNQQFVVAKIFNSSSGLLLTGLGSSFTASDTTWNVDTAIDQMLLVTAKFSGLSTTASITTKLVEINLT